MLNWRRSNHSGAGNCRSSVAVTRDLTHDAVEAQGEVAILKDNINQMIANPETTQKTPSKTG